MTTDEYGRADFIHVYSGGIHIKILIDEDILKYLNKDINIPRELDIKIDALVDTLLEDLKAYYWKDHK